MVDLYSYPFPIHKYHLPYVKNMEFENWRTRETAQLLKALAVLPEVPGSIPSTHKAAHNCNSNSRGSDISTDIHGNKTSINRKLNKSLKEYGIHFSSPEVWS